jgi:hypothetical protein
MAQYESYNMREITEIEAGKYRVFRTDFPDPGNDADLCSHTTHESRTDAHNCPDARAAMVWPDDQ